MKAVKLLFVMVVLLGFGAQAQDNYDVTRVNGKITNLKTGQDVVAGDVLNEEDVLLFESLDSYAIAIGSSMGRFQIKLQTQFEVDYQMLTSAVKDAAAPTKMRNLMLARFDPSETEVSDLRQYFGNDKFSIIGDVVNVPLSRQKYPLSDDKFIVFYYRVDNSPVSKKIGHDQQTLLVERDKLVATSLGTIEGSEIANLAVYEYETSTRRSNEITRFTLVFVDKNELVNEFRTIIPILKRQRMADDDIKKYLIEYYYDFYGATDSKTIDNFAAQIVKNF
jgi:hypothetical protein